MSNVDWKKHIHSDSSVLKGKPVVKGTRLSVEFIMGLLAEGWSIQQILKNYPTLSSESLLAVFAFTTDCLRKVPLYAIE
ncbi:MAG: DUF433 domain-containing protein [bacterium]|nr:DUF433 domain-containing protein [bacterium]